MPLIHPIMFLIKKDNKFEFGEKIYQIHDEIRKQINFLILMLRLAPDLTFIITKVLLNHYLHYNFWLEVFISLLLFFIVYKTFQSYASNKVVTLLRDQPLINTTNSNNKI